MTATDQAMPQHDQRSGQGRVAVLLALGLLTVFASVLVTMPLVAHGFLALGVGLLTASGVVLYGQMLRGWRQRARRRLAADFLANDPAFCFSTDDLGRVTFANAAANKRLDVAPGVTLAAVLQDMLGNPGTTLNRMQIRADANGGAVEEIATRRGHVRLSATDLGQGCYGWRVEEFLDSRVRTGAAMTLPMVTAGRSGAILSMNEAARTFVGGRVRALSEIFPIQPLKTGQICPVRHDGGTYPCFIVEAQASAGKREIIFLPSDAGDDLQTAEWEAFDGLPVAVMRLGATGEIVQSNRLARDLMGIERTEGVTIQRILEGLGRPIGDWLLEAQQGRGLNKSEFLRLKSVDKEVYLQVALNRVEEPSGPALIAVLHDATELKSLEAQFVQSQKMQAIGELAGGVAHDFNNLLTAISGHCDLLMLRHDQGDPDYADLVQIAQNANRAASLVGQLLAFSRKQTLRPEIVDLRETLADLTHLLNRLVGEKISLTLIHDPVLKNIRADKRQLEQVLMNLVVNARDAMSNGGEIRIETGSQRLDNPLERDRATVPVGNYVTVRVSDKGCGIPSDKLQKVFEPFFTTKRTGEGTGLGLSTAYGIVKQSGGYIFVDSTVDQDTVFSLFFPAHDGEPETRAAPPPAQVEMGPITREEGVVLLVEDEAPVRAFASRALKLRGYTVVEAGTGEEAMEILTDSALKVDLFITDVIMPGMNGPTWVRQARRDRPEVRVVFVSGYAEDALDGSEVVENSVFLPKPFSLNDLLETVQKQLA